MSYEVKVLADSVGPNGKRLTTLECTYPRFIHAEVLTHRAFSRNSASSRAIPVSKMIEQVETDPVIPVYWGKNQAGMAAQGELSGSEKDWAGYEWLRARDQAVESTRVMIRIGMHKQLVNRILEPFSWITTIISATEWENFFTLRRSDDAQPEIHHLADLMWEAMENSKPEELDIGQWHLPLIAPLDRSMGWDEIALRNVSVGRCARVSYLTHDGVRDPQKDVALAVRLETSGHWSPFEHVATPLIFCESRRNFVGWRQYRATID